MTAFVQFATTIISNTWRFLDSIVVPGLGGIHFSGLFLGVFLIGVAFAIVRRTLGRKEDSE